MFDVGVEAWRSQVLGMEGRPIVTLSDQQKYLGSGGIARQYLRARYLRHLTLLVGAPQVHVPSFDESLTVAERQLKYRTVPTWNKLKEINATVKPRNHVCLGLRICT